jgi:pyrroline-5-carboxylate reductase
MEKIIGFIGCGNMAQAMMTGIVNDGAYDAEQIYVSDPNSKALSTMRETLGIMPCQDNLPVAEAADILFLAVKPQIYPIVIDQIKDVVKPDVLIVTIGAGQKLSLTESRFGKPCKIIRVMPNTPAMVGEGMAAITPNTLVSDDETEEIVDIFRSFGKAEIVPESLMDVVTAVSGSSPAFVFMFIEALADGAVKEGMPRAQAYTFAAQTVLGSARMVLKGTKHPGELKDMVCSPGGTTIDAVAALEDDGFRGSVINAVSVCTEKSRLMSKD